MELRTHDDLAKYSPQEVEAFVNSLSPLTELKAFLKARNEPEVDLAYQRTQIARATRRAQDTPKLRETFRIEPSSIDGCSRKLWYQLQGAPKKDYVDDRLRLIFDTGHAIHEQLQSYFEAMWGWIDHPSLADDTTDSFTDEASVVIEDRFISGSTDGVRITPVYRYALEIKSINHDGFGKLTKPLPGHPKQFHCYMKGLDVPFGYILYYDKNNSSMQEFAVPFSTPLWDSIQVKTDIVLEADEDGPDPDVKRWACKQCNYKAICEKRMG